MKAEEYFNVINFEPMMIILKNSGINKSFLMRKLGKSITHIHAIANRMSMPTTDTIAAIGAYTNKPISSLVKFEGIEVRDFFMKNEFIPRCDFEGKVDYTPLFETVEKYKRPEQTINDLFDKVMYKGKPLSDLYRRRIMSEMSVPMSIIYEICKTLRCNIDYVLRWK